VQADLEAPPPVVLCIGLGGAAAQAVSQELTFRGFRSTVVVVASIAVDEGSINHDLSLLLAAEGIWGSRFATRLDRLSWGSEPYRMCGRRTVVTRRIIVGEVDITRGWRHGAQPATAVAPGPTPIARCSLIVNASLRDDVLDGLRCLRAELRSSIAVAIHEALCKAPGSPAGMGEAPPDVLQVTISTAFIEVSDDLLGRLIAHLPTAMRTRALLSCTPGPLHDAILLPVALDAIPDAVRELQSQLNGGFPPFHVHISSQGILIGCLDPALGPGMLAQCGFGEDCPAPCATRGPLHFPVRCAAQGYLRGHGTARIWRLSHAGTDTDHRFVIDGGHLSIADVRAAVARLLGHDCAVTEVEALKADGAGYTQAVLIRMPSAVGPAIRAWEARGLTVRLGRLVVAARPAPHTRARHREGPSPTDRALKAAAAQRLWDLRQPVPDAATYMATQKSQLRTRRRRAGALPAQRQLGPRSWLGMGAYQRCYAPGHESQRCGVDHPARHGFLASIYRRRGCRGYCRCISNAYAGTASDGA